MTTARAEGPRLQSEPCSPLSRPLLRPGSSTPCSPADRLAASKALRFASPSAIPDGTGLDTPCRPALAGACSTPTRGETDEPVEERFISHTRTASLPACAGRADRHDVQPAAHASAGELLKSNVSSQLKASRGRHLESPREEDPGEQPYATAVHPSEVSGFGSQASWHASPPAHVRVAVQRPVGALTELARYEVNGTERVLYGQRIAGCVRITDRPATGCGRSYLVERELRAGRLLGAEGARGRLHRAVSRARRGPDGEQRHQVAARARRLGCVVAPRSAECPRRAHGDRTQQLCRRAGPSQFSHAARAGERGNGPHPAGPDLSKESDEHPHSTRTPRVTASPAALRCAACTPPRPIRGAR